jgi:hypothetical protein|tara:strand:+ start:4216 stop:4410 length:195 start_codon:yes stop_codon:yes gene_type:complete
LITRVIAIGAIAGGALLAASLMGGKVTEVIMHKVQYEECALVERSNAWVIRCRKKDPVHYPEYT